MDETRKFLNSLRDGNYVAGPDAMENNNNTSSSQSSGMTSKDNTGNTGSNLSAGSAEDDSNHHNEQQQQQKQPGLGAIDKIIFCVFTAEEVQCYEGLMPTYFPIEGLYPTAYRMPADPNDHDDFNRDDARPQWKRGGGGDKDDGGISNIQYV